MKFGGLLISRVIWIATNYNLNISLTQIGIIMLCTQAIYNKYGKSHIHYR